ncbi:MAG: hypothetical protein J6B75_01575 [Ruminococcus sp.]|nr:hypothetical protein [Ruminococcus sp.]
MIIFILTVSYVTDYRTSALPVIISMRSFHRIDTTMAMCFVMNYAIQMNRPY